MADIELVIKIPEEKYNYVKNQVAEGIGNPLKVYIANGIPLNKIKAEIEQECKVELEHPYGQGLRRALEIIEKYKAESEGGMVEV